MLLVEAYAVSKCLHVRFPAGEIAIQIVFKLIEQDFGFGRTPFLIRGQLHGINDLRSETSQRIDAVLRKLQNLGSAMKVLARNADARSPQSVGIKELSVVGNASVGVCSH